MKAKYFYLFIIGLVSFNANCQKINPDGIVGEVEHTVEIINGEAVVTIPLPKLKGINGLAPEINLVYKSNQYLQNKEIGLGWSMSLSEIDRCAKSIAQDDAYDSIKYTNSDRFCLDGQRLIMVKGQYAMDQSEYRTEIESYQKVILFSNNSDFGPRFFKVFTKNNLILTYGATNDSSLAPVGVNATSRWLLSKIEDYVGNSISYSYTKEVNYCYLSSIRYANRILTFNYVDRSDVQTKYYSSRIDLLIRRLLKSVVLSVSQASVIILK